MRFGPDVAFLEAVVNRLGFDVRYMTGGIAELSAEVEGQCEVLSEFARSRFPRAEKGSIFVGAGDSYAAALAGFFASKGRCIALDPYSLASAPEIAEGIEVYFISVSGRTSANLAAARKVRGRAKKTTALTAVKESELSTIADRVVRLPMAYVPRTPGLLSFSLSLLAVMRIAGDGGGCDFRRTLTKAKEDAELLWSAKDSTYFLGNSLAYSAALYAAAKSCEILGAAAHAELLEEFSHMELFSLRKSDTVNIFSSFDPSKRSVKLGTALEEEGYKSQVVPIKGATSVERLFHSVFVTQLATIHRAMEMGISEPKFLSARAKLHVSDAMIY